MNISGIRRTIAKQQQDMLKTIFKGLGNDKFDLSQIDLSKFSIVQLSDFWLASTGFLGVQAFDNYEFTDYEAKNILDGLPDTMSHSNLIKTLKRLCLKFKMAYIHLKTSADICITMFTFA